MCHSIRTDINDAPQVPPVILCASPHFPLIHLSRFHQGTVGRISCIWRGLNTWATWVSTLLNSMRGVWRESFKHRNL